jgi:hypothetical protein
MTKLIGAFLQNFVLNALKRLILSSSSCALHTPSIASLLTWPKQSKANQSKAVPLHATEALGGSGGIAPTHSALDEDEWSASRPSRSLPRGKDTRYPLYRRLGGLQSRSGHRG